MRFRPLTIALLTLANALTAQYSLSQAHVVEGESLIIYVNGQTGLDTNPGTAASPLKTIQAGATLAKKQNVLGVGVQVLIASGIYRESVSIASSKTSAPITFEAQEPGGAIIDGADLVTSWTQTQDGDNDNTFPWRTQLGPAYQIAWQDTVSGCSLPANWYTDMPPVVLANEMVMINGVVLNQVMSAADMLPGTFYVDQALGTVDFFPPQSTNMAAAQVEIASRRSLLTVSRGSNLVFRGLVFQHGASCMNMTAATVTDSTNILFDSDVFQWNNWSGLGLSSSTATSVINTTASNNGGAGLAGYRDLQGLWQNNETDYNNWRGAMVGLYDFGQGGTKLMHIHGGSVSGHTSYNNQAQGLWFDTDNINVDISGATLVGNLVGNLQIELNQGPISVQNSNFCLGSGVQVLESQGVTFSGNTFYGNGGTTFQNAQLFIAGKAGGRLVTNWQTGLTTNLLTNTMVVQNNVFMATDSTQYLINTYLDKGDWGEFIDSLQSNNNTWYDASRPAAFGITGGQALTLGEWQLLYGQDMNSTWNPSNQANAVCTFPEPSVPDFQLLAHNAASYISTYTMSSGTVSIPLEIKSFNYGEVLLVAPEMPSGVSASFSTGLLTSGQSTLQITATSGAAQQTVPLTIYAIGLDRVHTLTVYVAVRPGPAAS